MTVGESRRNDTDLVGVEFPEIGQDQIEPLIRFLADLLVDERTGELENMEIEDSQ